MEAMNRKHYMFLGPPLYGTIGSCRVVPCFLFSRRRVGESYGLEIHGKYKALFNGTIYQRIIRGRISFMAYARVQWKYRGQLDATNDWCEIKLTFPVQLR